MKLDITILSEFFEHVPPAKDIEICLLKGPLLIERTLHKELIRVSPNSEIMQKINLRFAQKIDLVRAFYDLKKGSWIWEAVKKINQARNELAHTLSKEDIEKKIRQFVEEVEAQDPTEESVIDKRLTRFH